MYRENGECREYFSKLRPTACICAMQFVIICSLARYGVLRCMMMDERYRNDSFAHITILHNKILKIQRVFFVCIIINIIVCDILYKYILLNFNTFKHDNI